MIASHAGEFLVALAGYLLVAILGGWVSRLLLPWRPLFWLHVWLRRELPCGCHWHATYGAVVACRRHD